MDIPLLPMPSSQQTPAPLPTVHAYRDEGPVLRDLTRWRPRLVRCTQSQDHSDQPGTRHVVKYAQGQTGTAALISEVVCHALLSAAGCTTLDAVLVCASSQFAAAHENTDVLYEIVPGIHFGTVLLDDVQPGPPPSLDHLADATELIDIWVMDTWLMNIDRSVMGNLLMRPGSSGKWDLIPADQSDCFGGATYFQDGTFVAMARTNGPAESWQPLLNQAILAHGARSVEDAIGKVRTAAECVKSACGAVPHQWWEQAGIEPAQVQRCLMDRARNIGKIVDLSRLEGLENATRGGQIIEP